MRPVYNLTVEGAHCYFANGILTHNCDTVSMAMRHLRDTGAIMRGEEYRSEISDSLAFKGNKQWEPLYPV
jgi:hypothetical protein